MSSESVFHSMQGLLNDIFSGDVDMSLDTFEQKVEKLYNEGKLTGTQYDWLISNAE